jgi:hypothetical protein
LAKFQVTFEIEAATEDDVVKWAAQRANEIGQGRWNVEFKRFDSEPVEDQSVQGD